MIFTQNVTNIAIMPMCSWGCELLLLFLDVQFTLGCLACTIAIKVYYSRSRILFLSFHYTTVIIRCVKNSVYTMYNFCVILYTAITGCGLPWCSSVTSSKKMEKICKIYLFVSSLTADQTDNTLFIRIITTPQIVATLE